MNESELNKLFDVVDNYIDTNAFNPSIVIMTPNVFKHLRKQAYYSFASLLTVEVLTELKEYIIYTTKHLRDKYKRTNYRAKLIKELKQL